MTAAQPAILRPRELKSNDRGGGARTTPLVTRKCGSTSMSNGITAFDPGAAIGLHKHNCEESVMVLDGSAITANVPHRFINASSTEPMRIFWIYASIDATRTLIATSEERAIDAEHGHQQGAGGGK